MNRDAASRVLSTLSTTKAWDTLTPRGLTHGPAIPQDCTSPPLVKTLCSYLWAATSGSRSIDIYIYICIFLFIQIYTHNIHLYIYIYLHGGVLQGGGCRGPRPERCVTYSFVPATCYIPPVLDLRFSNKPCLKVATQKLCCQDPNGVKPVSMPVVTLACRGNSNAKHRWRYVTGM